MSAADRNAWDTAVAFYRTEFAGRSGVFDRELITINDELAQQPDSGAQLSAGELPPAVARVLRRAAPIYRIYWWPEQSQANQHWIASQQPRLRTLGPQLAAAMSRALRQAWPTRPIRVDVCFYVPEIGNAYTTDDPPHTTVSSRAAADQGLSGFEILFHEASHTFATTMLDTLGADCRALHKQCGNLWHATLFYTSGFELRRLLPRGAQTGFTPYADRYGLYTRGAWPHYPRVLEKDWRPYLDGKRGFRAALLSMAADVRPPR